MEEKQIVILIFSLECSSAIPLDSSMVTVTDSLRNFGADKAILTYEKYYDSTWCTNNTSGTAKIMVKNNRYLFCFITFMFEILNRNGLIKSKIMFDNFVSSRPCQRIAFTAFNESFNISF